MRFCFIPSGRVYPKGTPRESNSARRAWGCALAQMILADDLTYNQRKFATAIPVYQAAFDLFAHSGSDWGRALCMNGIAFAEFKSGRLQEAFRLARHSLDLLEQLNNQERTLQIRLVLAEIAEGLNDLEGARQYHTLNRMHSLRRGEEGIARYFQERLAALEKRRSAASKARVD